MFCARCGKEIDNDSTFCPFCGQKVDASVEKKKGVQPPSSTSGIKTMELIGGTVVVLTMLAGVAFGASKLAGGSDTKEVASIVEKSEEPQEDVVEASTGNIDGEMTAESDRAQKGDLYTITRDDVDHLVTDFLQMQANVVLYKATDSDLNNLSAIDIMDKYAGVFSNDEHYKVVADYNSNALNALEKTEEILLASKYKFYKDYADHMSMYFQIGLSVVESNIKEDGGFRYYGGTDAVIRVKLKYNFFFSPDSFDVPYYLGADPSIYANSYTDIYDSENDVEKCPDLYAVLVNCGGDAWGIKFLVADNSNSIPDGEAFTGVLVNEDQEDAVVAIDKNQGVDTVNWKKAYLNEIQAGQMDGAETYCLKDINDDGIPELYTDSSFTYYSGRLCYLKKDGTVGYVYTVYGYTPDKLRGGYYTNDQIYEYDRETGEYRMIIDGSITIDGDIGIDTYLIDNVEYSEDEYREKFDEILSWDEVSRWEDDLQSCSSDTLIDIIAKY